MTSDALAQCEWQISENGFMLAVKAVHAQSADPKEMRMKREYRFGRALLAALVLTGAGVSIAEQPAISPAGSWKTIDDGAARTTQ
jgi:hypothetical protein